MAAQSTAPAGISPPPYSSDILEPGAVDASVDPNTGRIVFQAGSFLPSSAWALFFQQLFNFQQAGGNIIVAKQNAFPALTAQNANSFIYVSDYFHFIYWDGSEPEFADGGSNYYTVADANPATGLQTAGGGWVPMEGQAAIAYLNADGTTSTRSLANLVGTPAYLKVGTGSSTISAAVAPTLTLNPFTPAGTNSAPALTMNSYTPQGTNSAPALTMNSYTPAGSVSSTFSAGTCTPLGVIGSTFTGAASGSTNVLNTGGATAVVPAPFTPAGTIASVFSGSITAVSGTVTSAFTGTPATLTGSVAAPAFTGTAATLTGTVAAPVFTGTPGTPTGTVGTNGTPVTFSTKMWYRV